MMGRMKVLLSNTRNINMTMSAKKIKYHLPLGTEKAQLGNLCAIEILENDIVLTFDVTNNNAKVKIVEINRGVPPELGYIKFD